MLDKYRLTPSATLAITAKAKQLSSLGKKIVSFAAGQPDFDTPLAIKEATKKALDEGFTKYTESSGIPELKKVLVDKLKQKNKLIYEAEQIIVSNGAKQILFEAIMCLADKGDEVIIKAPYWVSYPDMVKVAGGKSVFINDWDDLDKSLSAKTKVLIINSPSNPTGEIIDRSGLEKIAQIIKNYPDLRVLSDECYDCFYYGGQKPVSFASLSQEVYQKTLTINAFSKTFAMTGWRLGYGAGPLELIKAMSALQDQISSNPSSFSQKGALVAWEKAGGFPATMRREFTKRRKLMVEKLNQIQGIKAVLPDGAFYVWADISQVTKDDQSFCEKLLEEGGVAVIPGTPFGGPGFIRLSFATSMEQIEAGVELIKKFTEKNYG
ncbi:MAG: pyridoxal phosphate-dependent aminotransferase [Patescibacteria group bacterium]